MSQIETPARFKPWILIQVGSANRGKFAVWPREVWKRLSRQSGYRSYSGYGFVSTHQTRHEAREAARASFAQWAFKPFFEAISTLAKSLDES